MKIKPLSILFYSFIIGILITNNSFAAIVNFTSDTLISLTGLTTSLYVKSGSSCDSLVVNGTSLTVTIPADASFILKGSSNILSIDSSVGDTVLVVDSSHFDSGYLSQWTLTNVTTKSVNISIAVPLSDSRYALKINGELHAYYMSSGGLISFEYAGSLGSTKTFSIESAAISSGGSAGGGGVSCSRVPDGSTLSVSGTSILHLTSVSGVVNMAISNTPDFTNVGIEPFQSIKNWTFTSDKVYAKFYNSCGESSSIISASRQSISVPTPTLTPTSIITDPQTLLNSLLKQLADLQQQLANQQQTTHYQFTHGLQYRDTGEDVIQLQTFLKSQGTDIYPEGLITGYFGNLTKLAVQRFQEKYNIAKLGDPGYGYVGPKTRAKMNSL